jgi:hypothetical protein
MSTLLTTLAALEPAVKVNIGDKDGGAWYSNPLYVGIGVIVLLLVVLIAVTAARRNA